MTDDHIRTIGTSEYANADATDADAVATLTAGRQVQSIITSPPYGVGLDYGDQVTDDAAAFDLARDTATAWLPHMADGGMVAWNIGVTQRIDPLASAAGLAAAGLNYWHTVIWQKVGVPSPRYPKMPVAGRYMPHLTFEFVFLYAKGDPPLTRPPVRRRPEVSTDVWRINQTDANQWQPPGAGDGTRGLERGGGAKSHGHRQDRSFVGTMPEALVIRLLRVLTVRGDLVADPFCGSGTTAIVANRYARPAVTTELSAENYAIATARAEADLDGTVKRTTPEPDEASDTMTGTERRVDMVPLDDLAPNPANVKDHSLGDLYLSLGRFGVADLPVVDGRTGMLVSGHGRADALALLRDAGMQPPDGVRVDDDGTWLVPVVTGWQSANDNEASAYLVAANQTTIAGGWNDHALADLLGQLAETGTSFDGLAMDEDDLDDLRYRLDAPMPDFDTDPVTPDLDTPTPEPSPDPTTTAVATYADTPAGHTVLRMTVTDAVATRWVAHANQYGTTDDALDALL